MEKEAEIERESRRAREKRSWLVEAKVDSVVKAEMKNEERKMVLEEEYESIGRVGGEGGNGDKAGHGGRIYLSGNEDEIEDKSIY